MWVLDSILDEVLSELLTDESNFDAMGDWLGDFGKVFEWVGTGDPDVLPPAVREYFFTTHSELMNAPLAIESGS